jgi:hypothetical protein
VPLAALSPATPLAINVTVKDPKQVEAHGLPIYGHTTPATLARYVRARLNPRRPSNMHADAPLGPTPTSTARA